MAKGRGGWGRSARGSSHKARSCGNMHTLPGGTRISKGTNAPAVVVGGRGEHPLGCECEFCREEKK
ncbi:hypothetical protein A2442_02090 [Candidatus Campbellbacteria bacterium RIFOXYC2_FULL_35_25]|uniref:Uncharacterized protein n=1 Tax=Candidatus Campbellbacteria bacterium RIFOXYC2_FULL_35_25 TaxID=1797582 RepID=A0A1F5EIH5_9BACT|nr:MAG: hypothetical protein A2442_02090 [Candidatus Campbellbacteria bacterium RIFOXYC2_FULL_35_25]